MDYSRVEVAQLQVVVLEAVVYYCKRNTTQ